MKRNLNRDSQNLDPRSTTLARSILTTDAGHESGSTSAGPRLVLLTLSLVGLLCAGCATPPPEPPPPPPPAIERPEGKPPESASGSESKSASERQPNPESESESASKSEEEPEPQESESAASETAESEQPPNESGTDRTQETAESSTSAGSRPTSDRTSDREGQQGLAELEKQLQESLSEYDETLAGEREAIREARTASRTEEKRESETAPGSPRDAEMTGSDQSSGGQAGGAPNANDQGGGTGGPGSPPYTVANGPDRNGEDVVARQLRKAAEEETDPVLKEKIWEEYRRYTSGQTGPQPNSETSP